MTLILTPGHNQDIVSQKLLNQKIIQAKYPESKTSEAFFEIVPSVPLLEKTNESVD